MSHVCLEVIANFEALAPRFHETIGTTLGQTLCIYVYMWIVYTYTYNSFFFFFTGFTLYQFHIYFLLVCAFSGSVFAYYDMIVRYVMHEN